MVEYSPIPERVRELVRNRIHAIEHIEIVLALRDLGPAGATEQQLSERLRIAHGLVRAALEHLADHDLVSAGPEQGAQTEWRYAATEPGLDDDVAELARSYTDARVEMLMLISSNAMERLRSNSLKIFAEAFRLRGKKKDG